MARDKRTKPCGNCKKSKVKCEYGESLPCNRCINSGLASSCLFLLKLPSLKLHLINAHHVSVPFTNTPSMLPLPLHSVAGHSMYIHNTPQPSGIPVAPVPINPTQYPQVAEPSQETISKLEKKVESMDSKFNELLKLFHENRKSLKEDRQKSLEATQSLSPELAPDFEGTNRKRKAISVSDVCEHLDLKRMKESNDFRDSVISLKEAHILFQFFNQNISQQLFGFELKDFQVGDLWTSSPILICAICTISLIHYPDSLISSKQTALQGHLHKLCANIIFDCKPKSDVEVFNTIVALILCSFWLADSQRFTGLALQLAKEHQFNELEPRAKKTKSISQKDRLKLWYLLYILDGQQSMTFHRQALLSAQDDVVQNSRLLLLDAPKDGQASIEDSSKPKESNDLMNPKVERRRNLTDLRLVSQVEYNCALDEALKGNAWDLINPNAFGIPSKSNLELDKWMVSWTVLLAPMNNGTVWLSKSTLIYYNFAKMHINSLALRSLQADSGNGTILFPKWNNYEFSTKVGVPLPNTSLADNIPGPEEEFISNTELASQDQSMLNLNIAISAAQTVLNLVLNDTDISENLKYVPVHIHVMLYYAAFLLVSAPANMLSGGKADEAYFRNVYAHLKLIKHLQKKIHLNLPTDKNFGIRLLQSLDDLFDERIFNLHKEIGAAQMHVTVKADLINELSTLQYTYSKIELIPDSTDISSLESSPQPEKIYAWPASHHGHI